MIWESKKFDVGMNGSSRKCEHRIGNVFALLEVPHSSCAISVDTVRARFEHAPCSIEGGTDMCNLVLDVCFYLVVSVLWMFGL